MARVDSPIKTFNRLPTFAQADDAAVPHWSPRPPAHRAVPLVGMIRNMRSHRNKGARPELGECSNILVESPAERGAIRDALLRFARRGIDTLVIDGGDGTVRDVLTCGADIFRDAWPRLIVLPHGKTNALAVDLGLPADWSLPDALEAAARGNIIKRRPLHISENAAHGEAGTVQGFILGAGVFTRATDAGQEAHRWGAFNSFAVGLTILWGLFQTLFGRNGKGWRAPTPMRLRDAADGVELPRSRHGRRGERFMLFASTLERFPLGVKPFGRPERPGIKLGIMDFPLRWLVALVPAIMLGLRSRMLARNGAHQIDVEAVEMDLGGSFILDGEAFPPGRYLMQQGPQLRFVVP